MDTTDIIDVTQPVNLIIARFPATVAVFKAWGVDACCGGAKPLAEVASRHGLNLADLVADLARAAA